MCDLDEVLVPFWCFLSDADADKGIAPDRLEGEGDGEGFRSSGEGEGVDDGRLSSGERARLGRPSREDGGVAECGVDGPLAPRPFVSFSPERWEAGGARDGGLREEGGAEEEAVRRTCDAESARLRQGIFSRLTTGTATLGGKEEEEEQIRRLRERLTESMLCEKCADKKQEPTMTCSALPLVDRQQVAPC